MNILVIIDVKMLVLIKRSYRPPPLMLTIEPRNDEHVLSTSVNNFLTTRLFGASF